MGLEHSYLSAAIEKLRLSKLSIPQEPRVLNQELYSLLHLRNCNVETLVIDLYLAMSSQRLVNWMKHRVGEDAEFASQIKAGVVRPFLEGTDEIINRLILKQLWPEREETDVQRITMDLMDQQSSRDSTTPVWAKLLGLVEFEEVAETGEKRAKNEKNKVKFNFEEMIKTRHELKVRKAVHLSAAQFMRRSYGQFGRTGPQQLESECRLLVNSAISEGV